MYLRENEWFYTPDNIFMRPLDISFFVGPGSDNAMCSTSSDFWNIMSVLKKKNLVGALQTGHIHPITVQCQHWEFFSGLLDEPLDMTKANNGTSSR